MSIPTGSATGGDLAADVATVKRPSIRTSFASSLRHAFFACAKMVEEKREALLALLAAWPDEYIAALVDDWEVWAREDQLPLADGDGKGEAWRTWLILGGRWPRRRRASATAAPSRWRTSAACRRRWPAGSTSSASFGGGARCAQRWSSAVLRSAPGCQRRSNYQSIEYEKGLVMSKRATGAMATKW